MNYTKDKKSLVIQSNTLIEQPYKLNAKEQIFLRWVISKIQPNDTDFKLLRLKVSDFMKMLGIKNGNEYTNIKKMTAELKSKGFIIKNNNKELQTNWFASVEYFDNDGIVELEFSIKMKPYLLQLQERFTSYEFGNICDMRGQYSFKLYDLLRQYATTSHKSRKFSIIDLRYQLAIDENEYNLYGDFKRRVLDYSVKEINQNTDIIADYIEEKEGKRVVGLLFKICFKSESYTIEDNLDIIQQGNNVIIQIKQKSNDKIILTSKAVQKLIQEKGIEKINYYIENLDKLNYQSATNPTGYFIDAVAQEYNLNNKISTQKKPTNVGNFEQREYSESFYNNLYDNIS